MRSGSRHYCENHHHRRRRDGPPCSSPKFELPDIPESAALNSLNWGQSSSNEYECFSFDLNRDENLYKLSGRYVDPESGGRIDLEDVLLNDEQLKSVEKDPEKRQVSVLYRTNLENNVYDRSRQPAERGLEAVGRQHYFG